MKTGYFLLAGFTACIALAGCSSRCSSPPLSIVPLPREATLHKGVFTFDEGTRIEVENETQADVARLFAAQFGAPAGFTPAVQVTGDGEKATAEMKGVAAEMKGAAAEMKGVASDAIGAAHPRATASGTIRFETDTTLAPENYRLDVQPGRIDIRASDLHGFFYALQSVRQQLPAAIETKERTQDIPWTIPAQTLADGPRFAYRGLMLDVTRYFLPPETIRQMIDGMALLKLNYLHLHLVDDNGWRLEIKRYPRLTEVGAWRVAREGDFAQHKNPRRDEPTPVGGFYTQEEMRALIDYAARRQITIIPEIEMPAHSNSALAAYPSLACPVVTDFIGVLPGLGGHAAEIIYCAGNEGVFTFLEGVIDEVCALFPSPYIHLGGDEASKTHWRKCPLCQARMRAEGLTEVEDLQGYFMQRMSTYVQGKGRQVMGWDELTNSRIPEGAIIFGWQGMGQAGYKAGQAGHAFIMTPAQVNYLIRYQGPQWFEPRTYFGNNTLKNVYDYEPVQPDWQADAAARLMGVQGSLWTEFVTCPADAEYLVFPRLAAVAEVAWSPKGSKDWPGFLARLDAFDEHLDAMGVAYARSMYNLDHRIDSRPDTLLVSISSIRPDVDIRYTVDGSEPSATSPLFTDTLRLTAADFRLKAQLYASGSLPVAISAPGLLPEREYVIRAATFSGDRQRGQTLTLALDWNKATTRSMTCLATAPGTVAAALPGADPADSLLYRLTNGLRGSDKYTDFEWCGWQGKDVALVVDLGRPQPIRQLILGCITNYGMGVHQPRRIALSVSDDGSTYRSVADRRLSTAEIFREGIRIDDQVFDFPDLSGRYIKVELENPGPCPADHTRPDQPTWIYLDEVIVR